MIKPNFLLVGAPKAGTSALYKFLSTHPDIFLSKYKEPKYFMKEGLKEFRNPQVKWIDQADEYYELFSGAANNSIIGEASAFYLHFYEEVIPKVKAELVDPYIVIILRDPIQRAHSAYRHMIRSNPLEKLSFSDAIRQDSREINHPLMLYREMGVYSNAINAYKNNFSKVLILIYEEVFEDIDNHLTLVFDFLNVDRTEVLISNQKVNQKSFKWSNPVLQSLLLSDGGIKNKLAKLIPRKVRKRLFKLLRSNFTEAVNEPIAKTDYEYLVSYFKKDVKHVEKILGRSLNWLNIK